MAATVADRMTTRITHPAGALLCALLASAAVAACASTTTSTSTSSASASAAATSSATSSAASSASTAAAGTGTAAAGPQIGFEAVPLEQGPQLAPASTTGTGTVDGIKCGSTEQLAYHIHAHLAVVDAGRLYALPAGIGIPGSTAQPTAQGPVAAGGSCIYWLHTHTSDGIIHVESPTKRIYTLGNFFDEWHQPLSGDRVGTLRGAITAYINGKPWTRSVRDIPLLPHADIQFDIGEPTPPIMTVDWAQTQL